jgi:hypothetical protein
MAGRDFGLACGREARLEDVELEASVPEPVRGGGG